MKILYILFFLSLSVPALSAKDILRGHVSDKNKQPLIGVTVRWENESGGVATDQDGNFAIEGDAVNNHMLVVSYTGYSERVLHIHDYSEVLQVVLVESVDLKEVVFEKRAPGRISSRTSLLQTETVSTKELRRDACCNLGESFAANPSIDVSFSDAVTGAKQIQLLGLSGTYVQMLTENYPNFRGAASVYGMDYIPGPWMHSIQISKGAASVKNGYESVTGQMNVEFKKPQDSDPLSLNLFVSDAGRYEGNADASFILSDNLSTGVLAHYSNEQGEHDANGDTFLDMPKRHQLNLMNRWQYNSGLYASQAGFRYLQDYRTSGQTFHTLKDKTMSPYEIEVNANRAEFFTKNAYTLNEEKNGNVALIFTGSYHDQKSKYDVKKYNVYENNLYASLLYETELNSENSLSTGLSMNWDQFTQNTTLTVPSLLSPNAETTTGAYAQYTFNKGNKFVAMAGLRADYSTLHKLFVTPRLNVRYAPSSLITWRASAGKGYRTVFVMPENSFYLASNRSFEVAGDLKQEAAWNYGTSLSFHVPINDEELKLTGEWYRTDFENQVVTDVDSDAHKVMFYNLQGKSYANSFQLEASYPLFTGFNILAAYRWMDARTNYGGRMLKKPLTNDYKALVTASYETKLSKWVFDFTTQFNGGGRMPTPDAVKPLWAETYKPFTVMNAQVTRNFRNWSVYVGSENLAAFTQKNPIISSENPYSPDFDATMVWGPTHGRKFYLGLRYAINR